MKTQEDQTMPGFGRSEARREEMSRQGASYLPTETSAQIHDRWLQIQSEFVDDPRKSVADAQQLVAELMNARRQLLGTARPAGTTMGRRRRCLDRRAAYRRAALSRPVLAAGADRDRRGHQHALSSRDRCADRRLLTKQLIKGISGSVGHLWWPSWVSTEGMHEHASNRLCRAGGVRMRVACRVIAAARATRGALPAVLTPLPTQAAQAPATTSIPPPPHPDPRLAARRAPDPPALRPATGALSSNQTQGSNPNATFDWPESPPGGGQCEDGTYTGTFDCTFSDPSGFIPDVELTGPVTLTFTKSKDGEFLEITEGDFEAVANDVIGREPQITGKLDCSTLMLTAMAVDGAWSIGDPNDPVIPGGALSGDITGTLDPMSGMLSGQWNFGDPDIGACPGTWSVMHTP